MDDFKDETNRHLHIGSDSTNTHPTMIRDPERFPQHSITTHAVGMVTIVITSVTEAQNHHTVHATHVTHTIIQGDSIIALFVKWITIQLISVLLTENDRLHLNEVSNLLYHHFRVGFPGIKVPFINKKTCIRGEMSPPISPLNKPKYTSIQSNLFQELRKSKYSIQLQVYKIPAQLY